MSEVMEVAMTDGDGGVDLDVNTAAVLSGMDTGPEVESGPARDPETGQFVAAAGDEAETPEPEAAADEAAPAEGTDPNAEVSAEDPDAPPTEEATAEKAAAEPVKIAVPEFLHSRFGQELELPADLDPKVVELVRWSANNPVRHAEVQELRTQADQLFQRAVEEVEANNALRSQMQALIADPTLVAELAAIEDIRALHGDYVANLAAADLAARMAAPAEQKRTETRTQLQEQAEEQQAQAVIGELYTATEGRYTHWGDNDHLAAIRSFGAAWEASGNPGVPTVADYVAHADAMYVRHPAYAAEYQAQAKADAERREQEIRAAAKAEAAAEHKRQLEAAAARPRNPLARVAAVAAVAGRVETAPKVMSTAEMLQARGIG